MSEQLRLRAVELAVGSGATGKEIVSTAMDILSFLNDAIAPAQPAASSNSESSTTPAPRAARRTKATSVAAASTSDASATAAPSSTSAEASTAAAPSAPVAAAPAAPATSGTSQASSVPSLDAVRAELTQCQARHNGDMSVPRGVLSKYAPSGTLGTLKDEDRQKVIDECKALPKQ